MILSCQMSHFVLGQRGASVWMKLSQFIKGSYDPLNLDVQTALSLMGPNNAKIYETFTLG